MYTVENIRFINDKQGRSQTFDRGGAKGGAIENFLILEKFTKILENFHQNCFNIFE